MEAIKLKNELLDEKLLNEMARIGEVDDLAVYIRSGEGPIAHFHIMDSNALGSLFHTCIRIEEPKYFHHTGKEDILNSREIKELIKFLNLPNRSKRFSGTNWNRVVDEWNTNNPNFEIDEDIEIPDYTLLNK